MRLACVLMRKPGVILCDELTSSLDRPTSQMILRILQEASVGKTLVIVTHDVFEKNSFLVCWA